MKSMYKRLGLPVPVIKCSHPNISRPYFDINEAKSLSSNEVRKKYPRKLEFCKDCEEKVILYASFEHYIAGDW